MLVGYASVKPTTLEGAEQDALAYNNGKGGLQSLAASSAITRQEPVASASRGFDRADVGLRSRVR